MTLDIEQLDHWTWIFTVVAIVVCWEAAKRFLNSFRSKDPSSQAKKNDPAIDEEDYPDLQIPAHPHMEMGLDPPTGLHCSNSSEPIPFENDYARGCVILYNPPTVGGVDQWCKEYFKGKSRLWELRMQIQFKVPPTADSDLCFGVELQQYVPLNAAVRRVQAMMNAAIKAAIGGLYQSNGDDPDTSTGEIERPCSVLPLWAFDQFIVTPQGQEAPKLNDPNFAELGQKRYKRISTFVEELDAVKSQFDTVSTYTFASWGVSRFLDVINWRLLGIPVVTPIDFDKFAGCPPVYGVLYSLMPSSDDADSRHLQSRKHYYFRAAVWSSGRRPEKRRFELLTGSSDFSAQLTDASVKKKGIWRRTKGYFTASLSCCTSRPQG